MGFSKQDKKRILGRKICPYEEGMFYLEKEWKILLSKIATDFEMINMDCEVGEEKEKLEIEIVPI